MIPAIMSASDRKACAAHSSTQMYTGVYFRIPCCTRCILDFQSISPRSSEAWIISLPGLVTDVCVPHFHCAYGIVAVAAQGYEIAVPLGSPKMPSSPRRLTVRSPLYLAPLPESSRAPSFIGGGQEGGGPPLGSSRLPESSRAPSFSAVSSSEWVATAASPAHPSWSMVLRSREPSDAPAFPRSFFQFECTSICCLDPSSAIE